MSGNCKSIYYISTNVPSLPPSLLPSSPTSMPLIPNALSPSIANTHALVREQQQQQWRGQPYPPSLPSSLPTSMPLNPKALSPSMANTHRSGPCTAAAAIA